MRKNRKALALLSGGLDSTLAVKMMLDQGIEITAVNFTSPFCNCTPKKAGCQHQASKVADEFGIPIRVIPKGMDYMRIVENPPHGHGRGMNPCIDCRIYMLRKVKEMMPAAGASFVITGEVLGQRPMSQRRQQIALIERESGLEGLILRPLSAQNFSPTIPEQEGIVDRERLLAISGRSRKEQIGLARNLGVSDYPCPAGGCMLTDPSMAARLKDLFVHVPGYTVAHLHLLKLGRHFRIEERLRIIVGRNEEENEKMALLAFAGTTLFLPDNFRGPTVLAMEEIADERSCAMVGAVMARYSGDVQDGYRIEKRVTGGEESFFSVQEKFSDTRLDAFRIG